MLKKMSMLAFLITVSACSGGGGSSNYSDVGNGGGDTGTTSPTGPTSTSAADLAAWSKDGGTTDDLYNTQGVKRTARTATDENGTHTVRVDGVEGYGDGLVAYRSPNGTTIYQLADNAAPMGTR